MTFKEKLKLYFKTLTLGGKILYVLLALISLNAFWTIDNIFIAFAIALVHYLLTTDPDYSERAKEIFTTKEESI